MCGEKVRDLLLDELPRRTEVLQQISSEFKLGRFGENGNETILCETSETRYLKIMDYYIRGMSLFRLTPNGSSMFKEYGSDIWRDVRAGQAS